MIVKQNSAITQLIGRTFPFFIMFNQTLEIIDIGQSLAKIDTSLPGKKFEESFRISNLKINLSYKAIAEQQTNVFLLESITKPFSLKGQMLTSDGCLFFLGSPCIESLKFLFQQNLTINDFPPNDSTVDSWFVQQSIENTIIDTQELTRKLKAKHSSLQEAYLQLKSTEEVRYRDYYENAPDIYISLAYPSKTIFKCNNSVEKILGYTKLEFIGQKIMNFVTDAYLDKAKKTIQEFLQKGEVSNIKMQFKHKNGRKIDLDLSSTAVYDTEGRICASRSTLRDITRITTLTHQLELHKQQLEKHARINAAGEMLAELSHELNQPLTAMTYNLATIKRQLNGDDFNRSLLKENIQLITKQAEFAGNILHRTNQFLRKNETQKVSTNLNTIAEDALKMLDHKITKTTIKVQTEFDPELPNVIADPIEIEQVMINVLNNAIEAIVANNQTQGRINLKTLHSNNKLCCMISDNGPGIDPTIKNNLFDAFITSKSDGIGMGLAISRTIIHKHHGEIKVQPNTGNGTVFIISLPLDNRETSRK